MTGRARENHLGVLMALIRVMIRATDYRKWLRLNATPADLMKDPFGYDGQRISVYNVTAGVEEAEAVAAHYLTMVPSRLSLEIVSALRIEAQDLEDVEMVVDKTEGDTGITRVDTAHRDLIGDRDAFEALTQRIHAAIRRGEDRLRVVGPIQIKHQIEAFLGRNSDGVNDRGRDRGRMLLERSGV